VVIFLLARLKVRFLLVIMIVAITGLIMQSDHYSKNLVLPVLEYIMQPNTHFESAIKTFFHIQPDSAPELEDSSGSNALWYMPCKYNEVVRNYGWYWNIERNRQEFHPGIHLQVNPNTEVNSIISGKVNRVKNKDGASAVIISNGEIEVLIDGLKQVLVKEGQEVVRGNLIGLSSGNIYMEVKKQDLPINPDLILQ